MRKLVFATMATVSFIALHAQKIDDVQQKYSKGKYADAKADIDKILTDPKGQAMPSAWYWKGNVYSQVAKMDSTNQLDYDAAHEAFLAYKKYQEMDQKNVLMTIDQNVGLFIVRDVYTQKGDYFWNKKDYAKAFYNYKNALDVEHYITDKKFTYNNFSYPTLDTALVRFTAAAAYSAKQEDESMPYFEMLADAKIKEKDFRDIYALLVQYNQKKGNTAKADKYLAIGKELFPDNDYWVSIELGDISDKSRRMQKLEEMSNKYPDNAALALDYAVELRNYAYIFDTKPADYAARQAKYEAALNKAVKLDPNSELASYLLSEDVEIQISDMEDGLRDIKGNTPADVAKKKDINNKVNQKYEELLTASQKAYDLYSKDTNLKIQDKANYRKVINRLIDYYTMKKNNERVSFYTSQLKTL